MKSRRTRILSAVALESEASEEDSMREIADYIESNADALSTTLDLPAIEGIPMGLGRPEQSDVEDLGETPDGERDASAGSSKRAKGQTRTQSQSSKQKMTVLVVREGGQLSFYQLLDQPEDGDGEEDEEGDGQPEGDEDGAGIGQDSEGQEGGDGADAPEESESGEEESAGDEMTDTSPPRVTRSRTRTSNKHSASHLKRAPKHNSLYK